MKTLSDFQSLQQFNYRAAVAQFVVMCAFLIYFWLQLKPDFQKATTYRLGAQPFDITTVKRTLDYPLQLQGLFQINVPTFLLSFFAITVFAHLFYSTDGFGSGIYYTLVMQGWNPLRWLEYGISASIMVLILSILNSVRDIASWIPLVVSMAVIQGQGFLVENELIKLKPDWRTVKYSTLLGWVLLCTVFGVLGFSLIATIGDSRQFDNRVPAWVPLLLLVQLFNFCLFGFQQLKHIRFIREGKGIASFIEIERGYIKLSFFAKLVLAGFLCYGLIDWQNKIESQNPP